MESGELVEVPFATTPKTGGDNRHEGPHVPEKDIKDEMDDADFTPLLWVAAAYGPIRRRPV